MSRPQKIIELSFCALFIFVPLIWLSNTSELFEFNKIILTYILTVIIVGTWALRMLLERRIIFRRSLLDLPLLIFLASSFISVLFSIDVHTSIFGYYSRFNGGLLSLLSYALLYWAFVSNMDRKSSLLTISCCLLTAIPVALWGVLEHFGFSPSCLLTMGKWDVSCWVQDVQNRVFATMGQPNWLAAYLVALIFIPFSNPSPEIRRGVTAVGVRSWLIFALLFLTLLFTKSRSGLLAFAISSLLYWTPILFFPPKVGGNPKGVFKQFAIFALCVLTFTLLIKNPLRDYILKSPTPALQLSSSPALESGGTESGAIRKIVWTGAIRIWLASPKNFILGTGPETFAQSYYQYRPIEHNATSEWELLYNKAHNEFLNYLATTGLLGLLSYLLLLGTMALAFFYNSPLRPPLKLRGGLEGELQIALFAGWASLSITNFWGFSVVTTQLFLFLFPAIAVSLEQESVRAGEYKKLSGSQITGLIISCSSTLLLFYSIGKYWLADVHFASGQRNLHNFQSTQDPQYLLLAYQAYTKSYNLNPSEPAIASEFSISAAYLAAALSARDSSSAANLAEISLAASDKAVLSSPHHPNYYKSRARALILLSELNPKYLQTAITTLLAAQQISPTDPRIPYNIGVLYESTQATPSAIPYFQQALKLKPDFPDAQLHLQKATPN